MPKPYPPEFRRRALDVLEAGRSVRDVAALRQPGILCGDADIDVDQFDRVGTAVSASQPRARQHR